VADYLLLASADSSVQLRAIHESVKDQLKSSGLHPLHQEGSRGDKWIAIDYGGLLVHLMHTEVRSYYRLESLWDHPKQITWKKRTLASVVKKKKR
jgi:ribosome-associated protein